MSTLRIRVATETEIPAIAALHLLSWKTAYRGVVPDDLLDYDPTDSRTIEGSMAGWRSTLTANPENLTVAQYDDDGIVGFCCAGAVDDATRNAPFDFQVYGLHVDPAHYRRGIGSALFRNALVRMGCLGLNRPIVWTLEDLSQSRRFYEKLGGKVVREGMWDLRGHKLREVAYGWNG